MIPSVSFGSTYKVSSNDNYRTDYNKFSLFASNQYSGHTKIDMHRDNFTFEPYSTCTVLVPDALDYDIESYCETNGINYKKHTFGDLFKPENIQRRIKEPKDGKTIAYMDVERLGELIARQDNNLKQCRRDYYSKYRESVDYILKSGDKIDTTELCITPKRNYNKDSAASFIQKYGFSNLPCMFELDFMRDMDSHAHCMVIAFNELGMKEIPVYVDKNTNKLGESLGLLKSEPTIQ